MTPKPVTVQEEGDAGAAGAGASAAAGAAAEAEAEPSSDLVYAYNHSYHRSIRRAPADVNSSNVLEVWKTLYEKKISLKRSKFKKGDRVRISKAKRTFEKGYLPNWTREIFTVSRIIQGSVPYRYKVEDYNGEELEGTFYESELQKVIKKDDVYEVEEILGYKKRRVGKKVISEVKVRWKGYPSSFDSWIPQADLILPPHIGFPL